jgi:hypothetical protein
MLALAPFDFPWHSAPLDRILPHLPLSSYFEKHPIFRLIWGKNSAKIILEAERKIVKKKGM